MSSTNYKIQRALDQIRHTLPETVRSRLLSSSDDINPILVSIGDESDSVMCVVPVCVGDAVGYYCVNVHKVFVRVCREKPTAQSLFSLGSWDILSPTGFECLGGRGINRKWRISVRIVTEDGCEGKTLGQWLREHQLECLIPGHYVSSPKKKSRKDGNLYDKGNKSRREVLEVEKSPNKRKKSPVKNTSTKSPSKRKVGDLANRSQSHVYNVNASFSIVSFKDFLPVVTSGTPVMSSAWEMALDEPEPLHLSWPHEESEENMPGLKMNHPPEDDIWPNTSPMEPLEEDLVPFDQSLSKLLDL